MRLGRYLASTYTYGTAVPGAYLPDLDRAGCILLWGYNPSVARLVHATSAVGAANRGARLIVVDPRREGLARRADHWLRVRPGTDGALALALAHVLIQRGWFDRDFVRQWTNGPLLVRADTGQLLREQDLTPSGEASRYVAWDQARQQPVVYDPALGGCESPVSRLALFGQMELAAASGTVRCRPAFQLVADLCGRYDPRAVEAICGIDAVEIERAARTLWESSPVAYYAWSGVEQHGNATQAVRAIAQLYALTGCLDAPGGNVLFPAVHTAALDSRPYPVRGLVGFGANLLLAHADGRRGRDALASLDFYVHADLFMNPTAELADIVLPAASAFEAEALKAGFEVSEEAQSLVQLRRPVVAPRGEARSDIRIIFDLATRLGLRTHFWDGDVEAAYRHQLEPSGVSLDRLRAEPAGVRVRLETRHRKFAEAAGGVPRGFQTPTRRIELYSETLLTHGHPPLPEFEEPRMSPRARPDLARRYPLVLTCAKSTWFCESQHRTLPSLRRHAPDPEVELHPDAAARRGIAAGDWVRIETPDGSVRARARLNRDLHPGVVCGQHGWWQACEAIGAPGYDPFGPEGANLNAIIRHSPSDPVSGSVPLRAWLCDVAPAT